jgi:lipopolysaccharide export system ATP-binding protein
MRTLATEEIGKSYRGRRVVNGVSLTVEQGEVVGLLGPNGAGKTTTFYAIVGLIPPDTGRVLMTVRTSLTCPCTCGLASMASAISRKKLRFFRKLTVEENILAVLEAQPISWHERREKMEKLIDELGLEHIRQNRGYALVRRRTPAGGDCPLPCASTPHSFCWTSRFPGLTRLPCSTCRKLSAI